MEENCIGCGLCCAGGEGAVIPCKPFAFDLSCDPLFYWVILDRWIIIIIIIIIILRYIILDKAEE